MTASSWLCLKMAIILACINLICVYNDRLTFFRECFCNSKTNRHEICTKLQQLERLRSEDTPRRLMITHTIESCWIPSQN